MLVRVDSFWLGVVGVVLLMVLPLFVMVFVSCGSLLRILICWFLSVLAFFVVLDLSLWSWIESDFAKALRNSVYFFICLIILHVW